VALRWVRPGRCDGRSRRLGIPEYEAKRYEGKIRGGNVLIAVHTDDGDQRDSAREILEQAAAWTSARRRSSVPKSKSTRQSKQM
jgi:hypothetical protein